MPERSRSDSRTRSQTPPRSNCSTPRRQRGECYQDLYADAGNRAKRRQQRKEAKEVDSEAQLRASRESSLRATRRYRSSDNRTLLERSEDHLRRKADLQDVAESNRRQKIEQELKECTFRPVLQVRSIAARRAQDEREMERHLRQLAHKQLDVRARLVQLEREWARVHRQRKALFSERCKAVQHDRKQEVFDLLNTKEGQEYYWDRVQRLSESGSCQSTLAQSRVLQELLQDQRSIIEQQVGDEVDAELQVNGRNLDFGARRNVLLESLEAIEARAQPTLRMLAEMPEGTAILKESGFNQGLAQQMRDDVPDPNNSVSRQNSAEKVPAAEASAEIGSSTRVRSLGAQSPRGGSVTMVPVPGQQASASVQISTAMTSQTTLMDTEQHAARYVNSVASRGSLATPIPVQGGSTTLRPVTMPTRMVSATPSTPILTPGKPVLTPGQLTPSQPFLSGPPMVMTTQMMGMPTGTQTLTPPVAPVSQVVRLHSVNT